MQLTEKITIVHQSLRDVFDPKPYYNISESANWYQISTPNNPGFSSNGVFWSVMTDAEAAEKIAEVIQNYHQLGIKSFRWVVAQPSQPHNLMDLLLQSGFQKIPNGFPGAGMVATYEQIRKHAIPNNLEFREIGPEEAMTFAKITGENFGSEKNLVQSCRAIQEDLRATPQRNFYFLASFEGQPMATLKARIYPKQKFAYLASGSVSTPYRRKGYSLPGLGFIAEFLKARGITTYTTQTLANTSEPLCRALGFETVCQVDTLLYFEK